MQTKRDLNILNWLLTVSKIEVKSIRGRARRPSTWSVLSSDSLYTVILGVSATSSVAAASAIKMFGILASADDNGTLMSTYAETKPCNHKGGNVKHSLRSISATYCQFYSPFQIIFTCVCVCEYICWRCAFFHDLPI